MTIKRPSVDLLSGMDNLWNVPLVTVLKDDIGNGLMRKVLVVEDEVLIRLTIIDALEDAGFEVVEAATADDAVEIINEQTIHLLFTDIQMPGRLSGIDLAQAVAERFPNAGIIVASGRLTAGDIDLPPEAAFFSKPYDLSKIVDRLNAFAKT